jgi:hypothetical protein
MLKKENERGADLEYLAFVCCFYGDFDRCGHRGFEIA